MIVYIVDDDEGTRQSLSFLLSNAGVESRAFASPIEMLASFDESDPCCLVVDFEMPQMSGLELIREMRNRGSDVPFLLVTGHGTIPIAVQAMKLGAVTVIEKPFDQAHFLELLAGIEETIRHKQAIRIAAQQENDVLARINSLTAREKEVMELVVRGDLSKQIAKQLGISSKTVEVHRSNITKKMCVQSVAQLVKLVIGAKLIGANDTNLLKMKSQSA